MSWPTPRITQIRLQLMLTYPYLAAAVARLPIIDASKTSWCSTMATDGYFIYVNPAFCDQLTDLEVQAVFAHELLHCVLGHIDRRGNRKQSLWNIAIDHATNLILIDAGFNLPAGALADRHFHGMAAENIYQQLVDSSDSGKSDCPPGSPGATGHHPLQAQGGYDIHVDPSSPHGAATRSINFPTALERQRIRKELVRDFPSTWPGIGTGFLLEEIERAGRSEVDWTRLLAHFVTGLRRNDYRLYPFNKKHIWRQLYLPSIGVPGPDHLVVAVDTSLSMRAQDLAQVLTELDRLRSQSECALTVIHCDTKIRLVRSYNPWEASSGEFKRMQFHGRGGTDLRPPFGWVSKKREQQTFVPDALIYLTDGFGASPAEAPDYPVLWIMPESGSRNMPFGKVIHWPKVPLQRWAA